MLWSQTLGVFGLEQSRVPSMSASPVKGTKSIAPTNHCLIFGVDLESFHTPSTFMTSHHGSTRSAGCRPEIVSCSGSMMTCCHTCTIHRHEHNCMSGFTTCFLVPPQRCPRFFVLNHVLWGSHITILSTFRHSVEKIEKQLRVCTWIAMSTNAGRLVYRFNDLCQDLNRYAPA